MKSWTKWELVFSALVVLAAVVAPYVIARSLGDLMSLFFGTASLISTLLSLFLYAWVSALVTGVPFFLWARRGRNIWPWVLVLAACLGLLLLLTMNPNTTAHLVASITGYHNSEYIGFLLLYLIVCYVGMLVAVVLAAIVAWVLRKINY